MTVNRKLYNESGAFTDFAFRIYLAAMLGYYSMAGTQPESGSLAHFLRGKEGVEYSLQILPGNTGTIIGK
jgi:hypothetical protein